MDDIRIWKEDGWYIANIPALGISDQGRTLRELKKELKEAVELSIESILEDEMKVKLAKSKEVRDLLVVSVLNRIDGVIAKKFGKAILARA